MNALMHEVKLSLSDAIERNNAIIKTEHLPKVNAVPFQFSQLFINLIGNAIKYKKEDVHPQIHISSKIVSAAELQFTQDILTGDYLQLSIRDNGIGFEAEYREKIFELFKRLHPKEKYSGTGIGLSICKKIVYNHNGFIKAESEPGKGSSFHIFLPSDRIVSLPQNQIN
jgi:signal transduction histidine kinase